MYEREKGVTPTAAPARDQAAMNTDDQAGDAAAPADDIGLATATPLAVSRRAFLGSSSGAVAGLGLVAAAGLAASDTAVAQTTTGPKLAPLRVIDIRDYGAIADDESAAAKLANVRAFQRAQNVIPVTSGGLHLFVPPGRFFLSGHIRIIRGMELFGTGLQGQSDLVFDPGFSLIIERRTTGATGEDCLVRDLKIHSAENWQYGFEGDCLPVPLTPSTGTPGIKTTAGGNIQRVLIEGFTGTGIYIVGAGGVSNANQWRVHDCFISTCGGHSVHTDGQEAQGGLCTATRCIAIGGNGFFESSFGGNCYVACYAEVNKGAGFVTDSVGQSTFIGCRAETCGKNALISGGNVWLGGSGGFDQRNGFITQGSGVFPYTVPNQADPTVRLYVGYDDNTKSTYGWKADGEGGNFWMFRWLPTERVWSTELGNNFPTTQRVSFQTAAGHVRGAGVQGFPAMLLGPVWADGEGRSGATRIETTTTAGVAPASGYQRGDIIFNGPGLYADPANPPQFIGWVCVNDSDPAALVWKRFGMLEA